MRTAFIETLCSAAERDPRIWLLVGDLGFSVVEGFAGAFPERFVNVGVAEQNMTGIAAGLAMSGKVVFTYSIANFPTLRCLEQIRNDVCYAGCDVKIVSVGGGMAYGSLGYTHHGVEDLAVMRALPGLCVVAPGDPVEARLATAAVAARKGPCYLRLGKSREPVVHQSEPVFRLGDALRVREGDDVTLISTGGMLKNALDAAELLAERGIAAGVMSMHTLAPLDKETVRSEARGRRLLVTLEDHVLRGGLGGAVSEVVAAMPAPRAALLALGLPGDPMVRACSQDEARRAAGLDAGGIAEAVDRRLAGEAA